VPIYEYLCEACGRIQEVMQKVSDPPPRSCPECGARKLAKLVSRTAFQLKGGGWYADLYASRKDAKKDEGTGGAATTAAPAEGRPAESGATPQGAAAKGASGDAGKSAPAERASSSGGAASGTAKPPAGAGKAGGAVRKGRAGKTGS
jgi:putative FmdB family regulatory protein